MEKKAVSIVMLTQLFTILFSGTWMIDDVGAHAPGVSLSAWTPTPPNIDGIMDSGEWVSADVIPFTTSDGLLPGRTGTLYVMNDATNLYLAVAMPDTTPHISDICYFYFDNDHDSLFEMGDDSLRTLGVRPATVPQYEDLHWNPDVLGWTQDWYPAYEIYGTLDGSGDASNIEGVNYFEFSHPLDSTDDPHDFSISEGDTVGFALGYYDDGLSVGWFPGIPGSPGDYGDIAIALQPLPKTWTVDDDRVECPDADFTSIQEAINAANPGDTIHVWDGTYYENVNVGKSLTIQSMGAAELTIVQAANPSDHVVDIEADYVNVTGFTIRGATGSGSFAGVFLYRREFCNISANILYLNQFGILMGDSASHNIISNNVIYGDGTFGNTQNGIFLTVAFYNTILNNSISSTLIGGIRAWDFSSNNIISNNVVDSSGMYGIDIIDSTQNLIRNNNITNSGEYGLDVRGSSGNLIYHNNFINNEHQVRAIDAINVWDDGYPSGGNYWSDYVDVDEKSGPDQDETGNDGIWDHSYDMDFNKDRYPLVNPWVPRTVGVQVGDWAKYSVKITGYRPGFPVDLNDVAWGRTSVQAISGTIIEVELLFHLKNGTDFTMTGPVDVVTSGYPGPTFMSGLFISKDLPTGATLYATYPFGAVPPSLKINETIFKEYLGISRETNHVNLTTTWGLLINGYWDKATGVLSEYEETFSTSWSFRFKIVDTNLWKALNPKEATQELIDTIRTWELPRGTENSFISKLEDALHLLDIGNENGATHKLMELIHQAEALRGKKLPEDKADDLISEAQRIVNLIEA